MPIPYSDKLPAISAELRDRAVRRQLVTYGELGRIVGVPAQGPWKPVLDEIARMEGEAGRPDLAMLVVKSTTRLPGQIGMKVANPPTAEQRELAARTIKAVFAHHAGDR